MINIEKEREDFEASFEEKLGAHRYQFDLDSDGNYEDRETVCAWHMYLAGLNKNLEGRVVVPVEPTETMYLAGVEARNDNGSTLDVWTAMVEAARGGN